MNGTNPMLPRWTTDREMQNRWAAILMDKKEMRSYPDWNLGDAADSAVGFVYVDTACGLTFNVEAWCSGAPDELLVLARPRETRCRVMIRYDSFAGKSGRFLRESERLALALPEKPDWLENYREPDREPLRELTVLDPLRAPGFPDDIQCLMLDPDRGFEAELVWVSLLRGIRADRFVGRLLVEPCQDFGLHEGAAICVQLSEGTDGPVTVCVGPAEDFETGVTP